MLTPIYIAGLIRSELLRARSMATALARNLGQVIDNADRVVPFALTRLDDLLADDVIRLLGCLQGAHELHARLSEQQINELALGHGFSSETPELSTASALPAQAAA